MPKHDKTIREQALAYQELRERQLNQLAEDITTLFYEYGLSTEEFEIVFEMVRGNFEITEFIQKDDSDEELEED